MNFYFSYSNMNILFYFIYKVQTKNNDHGSNSNNYLIKTKTIIKAVHTIKSSLVFSAIINQFSNIILDY